MSSYVVYEFILYIFLKTKRLFRVFYILGGVNFGVSKFGTLNPPKFGELDLIDLDCFSASLCCFSYSLFSLSTYSSNSLRMY